GGGPGCGCGPGCGAGGDVSERVYSAQSCSSSSENTLYIGPVAKLVSCAIGLPSQSPGLILPNLTSASSIASGSANHSLIRLGPSRCWSWLNLPYSPLAAIIATSWSRKLGLLVIRSTRSEKKVPRLPKAIKPFQIRRHWC